MSRHPAHPLTQAVALLAALCVLALTVLAASPSLHAGLHAHDHGVASAEGATTAGGEDHACAVTLFAQGALALLFFCLLILTGHRRAGTNAWAADGVIPPSPRYRHVPSHAPPAA